MAEEREEGELNEAEADEFVASFLQPIDQPILTADDVVRRVIAPPPPPPVERVKIEETIEEEENFCEDCQLSFKTSQEYIRHCRGLTHSQKVLESQAKSSEPPIEPSGTPQTSVQLKGVSDNVVVYENVAEGESEDFVSNDVFPTSFGRKRKFEEEDEWSEVPARDYAAVVTYNDDNEVELPPVFICTVCDVKCTDRSGFQQHIEGRRHQKTVKTKKEARKYKQLAQGDRTVQLTDTGRRAFIQDTIDYCPDPLIGLQYIVEYIRQDNSCEPQYTCNLCDVRTDPRNIMPHIKGLRHRMNYIQEVRPAQGADLQQFVNDRPHQISMATSFARVIEEAESRLPVVQRMESLTAALIQPRSIPYGSRQQQPVESEWQEEQFEETYVEGDNGQMFDPYQSYLPPQESYVGPSRRAPLLGPSPMEMFSSASTSQVEPLPPQAAPVVSQFSQESVHSLLEALSSSSVQNEEDAAMALKITNVLTNALIKYRTQQQMTSKAKSDALVAEINSLPPLPNKATPTSQLSTAEFIERMRQGLQGKSDSLPDVSPRPNSLPMSNLSDDGIGGADGMTAAMPFAQQQQQQWSGGYSNDPGYSYANSQPQQFYDDGRYYNYGIQPEYPH